MLNKPWQHYEADLSERFESNNTGLILVFSTDQIQYKENNEELIRLLKEREIVFDDESNSVDILGEPHFYDKIGLPVMILNRQIVFTFDEAINLIREQAANGQLLFNGIDFNYMEKKRKLLSEKQQEEWVKRSIPFIEVSDAQEEETDND